MSGVDHRAGPALRHRPRDGRADVHADRRRDRDTASTRRHFAARGSRRAQRLLGDRQAGTGTFTLFDAHYTGGLVSSQRSSRRAKRRSRPPTSRTRWTRPTTACAPSPTSPASRSRSIRRRPRRGRRSSRPRWSGSARRAADRHRRPGRRGLAPARRASEPERRDRGRVDRRPGVRGRLATPRPREEPMAFDYVTGERVRREPAGDVPGASSGSRRGAAGGEGRPELPSRARKAGATRGRSDAPAPFVLEERTSPRRDAGQRAGHVAHPGRSSASR